ncbi:helix-turn-helix domain-containing protein [Mucilaginibacter terrigena]|uniref:Helix-turn-helix domain-containing protein n=1 Tax=Mucilaginibacter terrigena TaxID=2492395 RepID=A0A4Q5LPD2_9SPHI|nr:helix-turn-helix domain-containing protein [Mucilaginibacter terrigena]RYU91233.1 helix-turn-helix domain-containing protein [Mucilaginibacter terrigena]
MRLKCFLCLFLLVCLAVTANAYKIIAPEPFSIAAKNYIKLQVLADKGDTAPDSVVFEVLYNSGNLLRRKSDASLSMVITLNDFNDGVFYVKARVYHNGKCDILSSKFDEAGVPVILDRHSAYNETTYQSAYKAAKQPQQYSYTCNNNKLKFNSRWDVDSLYFDFEVQDANLNYVKPGYISLFQTKKYLRTLWDSDCIEIGLDMQHDRSVWKKEDDYELLVDVTGNYSGNRWDAGRNFFKNWGRHTRVKVKQQGTLNNNQDIDKGYTISIAIPWAELNYKPVANTTIGFDIQLYDKDAQLDEAFRTSLSGTNPESNDNTSEWTSLTLARESSNAKFYLLGIIPLLALLWMITRKRKDPAVPIPMAEEAINHPPAYSESIRKAIDLIHAHYHDPHLSRQQIAGQVFISEKYLSSLFNKETGVHLIHYINKYRVDKAIELLQHTRLSVSEIAFKVGYNSLQNFNKNFKAISGKAPSNYRH